MRTSSLSEQQEQASGLGMAEEAIYQPTERDKRLKAEFWLKAANHPFVIDPSSLSLEGVRNLLGKTLSPNVWARPGFKEWFVNRDENRARLEYLFTLALEAAEQILKNEDPKAQSARVNLIKAVAELAGKTTEKNNPTKQLAGAIAGMDKAQLQVLLEKNGVNLRLTAEKSQEIIIDNPTDIG